MTYYFDLNGFNLFKGIDVFNLLQYVGDPMKYLVTVPTSGYFKVTADPLMFKISAPPKTSLN
jgi:hypothetical protein